MLVSHPLDQQFIRTIQQGFCLLGDQQQEELLLFVTQAQDLSGGFMDRGKVPDLYYSVFGGWLLQAFGLENEFRELKTFLSGQTLDQQGNSVHRFALLFLQQTVLGKRLSAYKIAQKVLKRDFPVNFFYQLFLTVLLIDSAFGKKRWIRIPGRVFLSFCFLPKDSPCSMLAAFLIARSTLNMKTEKTAKRLLSCFRQGAAFVAFEHMDDADMLSTGVALFALRKAGVFPGAVASDCLMFIQENYINGAFRAGSGDPDLDVEYTFYGLLALGSLSQILNENGGH